MTPDDIIRMAQEAGFQFPNDYDLTEPTSRLERFAALVAAHEREECAKLAGQTLCASMTGYFVDPVGVWGTACESAIRARGNNVA